MTSSEIKLSPPPPIPQSSYPTLVGFIGMDYGIWNIEYGIWNVECGMWNVVWTLRVIAVRK